MFELSGVGMFQADAPAFHFTRVNQTFCEMTGYSAEELLTNTYIGLTHPDDRRRDMRGLMRVIRARTDSWSIEKRCIHKDGRVIWINVQCAVVRDDAGRAARIMAMVSNVAARMRAEQTRLKRR
jgi:PAS domain S-box-containing protein